MPFDKYIGDSTPEIKTQPLDNWKPVSAVAAALVLAAAKRAGGK